MQLPFGLLKCHRLNAKGAFTTARTYKHDNTTRRKAVLAFSCVPKHQERNGTKDASTAVRTYDTVLGHRAIIA